MRDEERAAGDPYYIQASSVAADRPKLVLKHNEAFLVADSRGDFPDIPESAFGFYVDGTRFLSQLELVMHGPPLVLNAALSEDTLQIAVDLTNPDIDAEVLNSTDLSDNDLFAMLEDATISVDAITDIEVVWQP